MPKKRKREKLKKEVKKNLQRKEKIEKFQKEKLKTRKK